MKIMVDDAEVIKTINLVELSVAEHLLSVYL
jgi:hypothetical protein